MTETDEAMIKHFDELILQSEKLKDLKGNAGWQEVEKVLKSAQKESIMAVMGGSIGPESLDVRIGHARFATYFLNLLDVLINKGEGALIQKERLLEEIRDISVSDHFNEDRVRYSGHEQAIQ